MALYSYAFNPALATPGHGGRGSAGLGGTGASSATRLADPAVLRPALDALTIRLDGQQATANTIARKHAALGCAVETGLLDAQLREYFPAALEAFEDLGAPDTLELLAKAPEPARAARLTRAQLSAAFKRAGRRNITDRATAVLAALRGEQLGQPPVLTAAYAATARSLIAVIIVLNEQVKVLQGQVEEHFGRHPDAEIIVSRPGLGPVLGARVLAEFGDDPRRYADGKARWNYAATSPITRASGKRKVVAAGSSTTTGSSTPSMPGHSPP